MAKNTVELTSSYQKIASGECIITIVRVGDGSIYFNDVGADTNAFQRSDAKLQPGDQFSETEPRDTFAKGDGWTITIDGVL